MEVKTKLAMLLVAALLSGTAAARELAAARQAPTLRCGISALRSGEAPANYSAGQRTPRVWNGFEAYPGQKAYQVWIGYRGRFYCGGSIIDERHVLTAAHCLYSEEMLIPAAELHVVIGDHDRRVFNDGETIIQVERASAHESYFGGDGSHDIAILRLSDDMQFGITASGYGSSNRICLPSGPTLYEPALELEVSGWGCTHQEKCSWDAAYPSILRYVKNYVAKDSDCASVGVSDICLLGNTSRPSFGDSGGPITRRMENGQDELVGVVSQGGRWPGAPWIGVNVASYLDWIAETIESFGV